MAGENVTIDASEDNKKIVISAAGGGGTGDVTAAGNNTFTGKNTFTNEITFNTMKSEAGGINFGNFEGIMEMDIITPVLMIISLLCKNLWGLMIIMKH